MNHIITAEEVGIYGRSMSSHIDRKVLEPLIEETENMDIIPALGVAFVHELIGKCSCDEYTKILLEGGYYNDGHAHLQGLKSAMAYYVQAKLVKVSDNQITRFGVLQKNSEYGYRPSIAERTDTYNDLCAIADSYLRGVLDYLNENIDYFPTYKRGKITNTRTIYRVLGA